MRIKDLEVGGFYKINYSSLNQEIIIRVDELYKPNSNIMLTTVIISNSPAFNAGSRMGLTDQILKNFNKGDHMTITKL